MSIVTVGELSFGLLAQAFLKAPQGDEGWRAIGSTLEGKTSHVREVVALLIDGQVVSEIVSQKSGRREVPPALQPSEPAPEKKVRRFGWLRGLLGKK